MMEALQTRFSQNYERLEKGEYVLIRVSKIFRVLDHVRETDRRAYEPKVIAIGPYHVNNPHLRKMDEIKLVYLQRFLDRNPNVGLKDYKNILQEMKEPSKYWYSDEVEMDEDLFWRMLLIDGCFILELLLGNLDTRTSKEDPILGNRLMLSLVEFDMLLLDNQMPLVILERLYSLMGSFDPENNRTFVDIFVESFRGLVKGLQPLSELPEDISNIHHLLHLFHACFITPPLKQTAQAQATESMLMTPCATDLKQVGAKFRPIKNAIFTWNLSNDKHMIDISPARLNSNSNSFYRNLIAFEQYFFPVVRNKVMTYVMFMSCLVDTEADLALLGKERIVVYTLNYKEAATFFRKLCTDSIIDSDKSHLCQLKDRSADVWRIYDTKWVRTVAYIKNTYFNDPLNMVYLGATVVFVVVLTILQTVYTILSYYNRH